MNQQTTVLISATAGLAVIALIVAISAHRKLAASRRSLAALQGTTSGKTLLDAVATYGEDLKLFESALNKLLDRQDELALDLRESVHNVSVVRYDAFEDMGGRLSFSAALVDDHGTGLVLSAISGRTEARVYAKLIEEGESDSGLSPEEVKAISDAMSNPKRSRPRMKARR